MKKPTPSQMDAARRLLAHEAQGVESAEERAAVGRRVYEKTVSHLATILGSTGARLLFTRSVKLTAHEFPCLRAVNLGVDGDVALGEQIEVCLRVETPDAVTETMVSLYATLLAVLETLIGEELTTTVLRDPWPAFRASNPKKDEETK